jgi:hypothetical protein
MKRSAQVALVVAAATGVGGAGYAMMPSQSCTPQAAGNAIDASASACTSRSSSGGSSSGYRGGRSIFGTSGSGSSAPAAQAVSSAGASSSGATTRGGFGGFFHSLGAHIGG